jgi:hypothetical protein
MRRVWCSIWGWLLTCRYLPLPLFLIATFGFSACSLVSHEQGVLVELRLLPDTTTPDIDAAWMGLSAVELVPCGQAQVSPVLGIPLAHADHSGPIRMGTDLLGLVDLRRPTVHSKVRLQPAAGLYCGLRLALSADPRPSSLIRDPRNADSLGVETQGELFRCMEATFVDLPFGSPLVLDEHTPRAELRLQADLSAWTQTLGGHDPVEAGPLLQALAPTSFRVEISRDDQN